MPRPLIPPEHVTISSSIVYTNRLTPVLRDTYIQLKGLAWGQDETPELSIPQIAKICNKSVRTVYGHIAELQLRACIVVRAGNSSTLILGFPTTVLREDEVCKNLQMLNPLNSFSDSFDSLDLSTEEERIAKNCNAKIRTTTLSNTILKPMVNTLAEVTGMDERLNYAQLAKVGKRLILAGYTAQQVATTYGVVKSGQRSAWYEKDWRGKKLQKPSTGDILKTIAELCKNLQSEEESRRAYAKWEDL